MVLTTPGSRRSLGLWENGLVTTLIVVTEYRNNLRYFVSMSEGEPLEMKRLTAAGREQREIRLGGNTPQLLTHIHWCPTPNLKIPQPPWTVLLAHTLVGQGGGRGVGQRILYPSGLWYNFMESPLLSVICALYYMKPRCPAKNLNSAALSQCKDGMKKCRHCPT